MAQNKKYIERPRRHRDESRVHRGQLQHRLRLRRIERLPARIDVQDLHPRRVAERGPLAQRDLQRLAPRRSRRSPTAATGNWSRRATTPRNDDGRSRRTNARRGHAWLGEHGLHGDGPAARPLRDQQTAQAFGVHRADGGRPADESRPIVLGTNEIAPVTMAAAFAGIANNGLTCTPIVIDRIVKSDGTEVTPPGDDLRAVGDPRGRARHGVRDAATFVSGGTATASEPGTGVPHIGKTGTTDNAKDTWMIGASTKVATAVWVGNVEGDANLRELSFDSGAAATAPSPRSGRAIMGSPTTSTAATRSPSPTPSAFKQVLVDVPDVRGDSRSRPRSRRSRPPASASTTAASRTPTSPQARSPAATRPGRLGRGATIRVFTSNGQAHHGARPHRHERAAGQGRARPGRPAHERRGGGEPDGHRRSSQDPAPRQPGEAQRRGHRDVRRRRRATQHRRNG